VNTSRILRNAISVLIFAVVCIVGMEFLAINIGQPNPLSQDYTIRGVFTDANGIPTAADVRVAGVVVGKVTNVSHDPKQPGVSVVTLQIGDPKSVPVYSNGYAKVRPKTLLGEKYIDLTVGDRAKGEAIAAGGYLPQARTAVDVENDQIFNAFDAKTRQQQQQVLQELDKALQGRSGDVQAILPQLTSVVNGLQPLAKVYEKDNPQVDNIFVQLNTLMATLADEHTQIASLLANGNVAFGAIAQRNDALVATLQEFSNVATEINTAAAPTVAAQRAALDRLAPALGSQTAFFDSVMGNHCDMAGHAGNAQACGVVHLFTGTLLGQINWPNDQLNVSTPPGEAVTNLWDKMFSTPLNAYGNGKYDSGCSRAKAQNNDPTCSHSAQNIVLSFHCDEILASTPGQLVDGLHAILGDAGIQALKDTCQGIGGHTSSPSAAAPASTTTSTGPTATEAAWLAGRSAT
jgi:phospholipid/cholesterol/gamma-HCH transport system substrate-binding protein